MVALCAIASGSNGNCYYIGNHHDAILIDAGISARQTIARMKQRQLDPLRIKAVFISHEHSDHASGAYAIGKRLKIPVYLTSSTYLAMFVHHRPLSPRFFKPGNNITVGSFNIYPFLKRHDAAEPCSFRIEYGGLHIGVFTDIGSVNESVMQHFRECHAIFLETNYDEQMLWNGRYPFLLKQRIASDQGHLSNDQAFELLKNHSGSHLRKIFLSHLSAENNTPEIALKRFSELADRFSFHLTSRYGTSEVIYLGDRIEQGILNFDD